MDTLWSLAVIGCLVFVLIQLWFVLPSKEILKKQQEILDNQKADCATRERTEKRLAYTTAIQTWRNDTVGDPLLYVRAIACGRDYITSLKTDSAQRDTQGIVFDERILLEDIRAVISDTIDKADVILRQLANFGNKKLLFYPSCGMECGWVFEQGCDIVVCTDYYPRNNNARRTFWHAFQQDISGDVTFITSTERAQVFRVGETYGFLFFRDNNEVRERIRQSGHTISYFVGICDGCREGGNYECVNDQHFLQEIFKLIHPTEMTYVTDHSSYLLSNNIEPSTVWFGHQLLTRITFNIKNIPQWGLFGRIVAYSVKK